MQLGRAVVRWLLTLFIAGVAVQFFLAGLGVFRVDHVATKTGTTLTTDRFDHFFDPHIFLGTLLAIIAILVFVAALIARVGRPRIFAMLALPVLVILQFVFAGTGPAWFRAFHVLNAFVIAGLAGTQTGIAWREARTGGAEPAEPQAQAG
jgi:ABC-type uncharacterized transport system permease subunit